MTESRPEAWPMKACIDCGKSYRVAMPKLFRRCLDCHDPKIQNHLIGR